MTYIPRRMGPHLDSTMILHLHLLGTKYKVQGAGSSSDKPSITQSFPNAGKVHVDGEQTCDAASHSLALQISICWSGVKTSARRRNS